jgi:hypothetical protein
MRPLSIWFAEEPPAVRLPSPAGSRPGFSQPEAGMFPMIPALPAAAPLDDLRLCDSWEVASNVCPGGTMAGHQT